MSIFDSVAQGNTPKMGLSQLIDKFLSRELSDQLSSKENSLLTRTVGGTLGMFRDAAEYDYPDTALGWASMPAKGVTAMAEGMMGIPGAMIDDANAQVAGLSDGSEVTEGALGMLGTSAVLPFRRPAGSVGSFALPMTDDVRDAYSRRGNALSLEQPKGLSGKDVGIKSPYMKSTAATLEQLEMMDAGLKTAPIKGATQRKEISIQDLMGQKIFPLVGDRTSNARILEVMGSKIAQDVGHFTEGGFDYTFNPNTGLWASHQSPINRLQRDLIKNEGGVGYSAPMAGTSSDFSMHGVDLAYDMGSVQKMSKAAKKHLTDAIRHRVGQKNSAMAKKENAYPDFPGMDSPKAYDYFKKYPDTRKFFMEELSKKEARAIPTMPDSMVIRHAITEPGLRNLTVGDTDALAGQSFVKFGADPKTRETSSLLSPHNTYQADLYDNDPSSGYLGGLAFGGVPRSLLSPAHAADYRARGLSEGTLSSSYKMEVPFETVTPELADGVDQYLYDLKRDIGQ